MKTGTRSKRFLSILLTLMMVLTLLPTVAHAASGSGTESNPYLVGTYDELRSLVKSSGASAQYIKLNADIIQSDYSNGNDISLMTKQIIYLDLAGHKLVRHATTTDDLLFYVGHEDAELIIDDSVGGGIIECNYGAPVFVYEGKLTINGGTLSSTSTLLGGYNYALHAFAGDVTINGGTFKAKNDFTVRVDFGTLTVYGGDFYVPESPDASAALLIDSNNGDFTLHNCNIYGNSSLTGDGIFINGKGDKSSKYIVYHIPTTSTVTKDGVKLSQAALTTWELNGKKIEITGLKPLEFKDSSAYGIPAGTGADIYVSTKALTATGGKAPYTFTVVGNSVFGLTITNDNKLRFSRPVVRGSQEATIQCEDSNGLIQTITIKVGEVVEKMNRFSVLTTPVSMFRQVNKA